MAAHALVAFRPAKTAAGPPPGRKRSFHELDLTELEPQWLNLEEALADWIPQEELYSRGHQKNPFREAETKDLLTQWLNDLDE